MHVMEVGIAVAVVIAIAMVVLSLRRGKSAAAPVPPADTPAAVAAPAVAPAPEPVAPPSATQPADQPAPPPPPPATPPAKAADAPPTRPLPMSEVDRTLAELARDVARTKTKPGIKLPPRPADAAARKPAFKPVLGIDFGTSNTCAAWIDAAGTTRVVPVDTETSLPSVVWFSGKDRFVVGAGARERVTDHPSNTIYGFKRFLGRAYKSEFVTRNRDRFAYKLVEGPGGIVAFEVFGEVKPIADLAFFVFQRILELARADAGVDFDECVLTVPAHYGYPQREAIRRAAEMAGLEVKALVNEPTAAAFFYSRQHATDGTALIYDLGGGTFDATLIAIENEVVKVLATGGDAFLGGADFDEKIAQTVARDFEKQHGVDLTAQKVVMQRLTFACEKAKMALSEKDAARVQVMFAAEKDGRPLDIDFQLTREAMEIITAPLVERTLGACDELLRIACMDAQDVDEVILVGGQTRTQALRRRVFAMYKFDPEKNLSPELTVCVGAAMLGRAMQLQMPSLVDVVSVPIWVTVPGAGMKQVLHSQTAVPCVRRIPVDTRPPGDGPLAFVVFEALEATSVDRAIFGRIVLEPEWLKANPGPIQLEFKMQRDFALNVTVQGSGGARSPVELVRAH